MKYVEELGIYVTKVEDLRDKVSPDLYDTVEHLIQEDSTLLELQDRFEDLRCEFEAYESMNEDLRRLMLSMFSELKQIQKKVDYLGDYIQGARRINREKLDKLISDIKVDDMIDEINIRI